MRKRIVVTVLMAALTCLLLMGAAAPAKPLDLVGNWEEKDKGDSYQAGYIKEGKDGKIFIDTLKLPPCLLPSCRRKSVGQNEPLILTAAQAESNDNFCHLM